MEWLIGGLGLCMVVNLLLALELSSLRTELREANRVINRRHEERQEARKEIAELESKIADYQDALLHANRQGCCNEMIS